MRTLSENSAFQGPSDQHFSVDRHTAAEPADSPLHQVPAKIAHQSQQVGRLTQLQAIANEGNAASRFHQANDSGLPNALRSGIEQLSGISMAGVNVHYNSSKPAQLHAHAFAQGRDIHLAPGQERHLPHEAWHVVQQAQGRVKPTLQLKGIAINDDTELEREAEVMGARVMQSGRTGTDGISKNSSATNANAYTHPSGAPIQRYILKEGKRGKTPENAFQKFPKQQLMNLGVTLAEVELARKFHEDTSKYYTLSHVAKAIKAEFLAANKGVRVAPQQGTTRLSSMQEVIDYLDDQQFDTTDMVDHFQTKQHDSAMDAVLALVPLTEDQIDTDMETKGPLPKNFMSMVNQQWIPTMVRTPSMLLDIATSMSMANRGSQGFVSSSKGSMFENWIAQNVIASCGKVTISKQGKMNRTRSSDGYDKAKKMIYDAKLYDAKMPLQTNFNQYDDYVEILTNGIKGDGGEVITDVCYIFPDQATALLNTHLKQTHIFVAYPAKGTTNLAFV